VSYVLVRCHVTVRPRSTRREGRTLKLLFCERKSPLITRYVRPLYKPVSTVRRKTYVRQHQRRRLQVRDRVREGFKSTLHYTILNTYTLRLSHSVLTLCSYLVPAVSPGLNRFPLRRLPSIAYIFDHVLLILFVLFNNFCFSCIFI
jgi:hypothetical protein